MGKEYFFIDEPKYLFILSLIWIFVLVMKQFQEYIDPEQADEKRKIGSDEESVVLPLDPSVLTDNLGFPITVVCTKVTYDDNKDKCNNSNCKVYYMVNITQWYDGHCLLTRKPSGCLQVDHI